MELNVKVDHGTPMEVTLAGDLDASQRKKVKDGLEANIEKYKPKSVIIDCTNLTYIDSTGLGVLVSALKKAKEHGGVIRIVNLKPFLMKIFRVTGLTEIFDMEDSHE